MADVGSEQPVTDQLDEHETPTSQQQPTWRPNPFLLAVVIIVATLALSSMVVTNNRVALWFCLAAGFQLGSVGLAAAAICWELRRSRS